VEDVERCGGEDAGGKSGSFDEGATRELGFHG